VPTTRTDLDELHQQLRQHIAEAQRHTRRPISRRLPPRIQSWKPVFVKAQYFPYDSAFQRTLEQFIDRTKSCTPWHPLCTFATPARLPAVHQYSMSQCWNSIPESIPNRIQPPPPPLIIEDQPEFESSEILDTKMTTDVVASFNILSMDRLRRH